MVFVGIQQTYVIEKDFYMLLPDFYCWSSWLALRIFNVFFKKLNIGLAAVFTCWKADCWALDRSDSSQSRIIPILIPTLTLFWLHSPTLTGCTTSNLWFIDPKYFSTGYKIGFMISRDLQELTMCNEKLLFVMNLNCTHGFIETLIPFPFLPPLVFYSGYTSSEHCQDKIWTEIIFSKLYSSP